MLRETLKSSLLVASNEEELDAVLLELSSESRKGELREVVLPLLPQVSTEQESPPTTAVDIEE